MLVENFKGWVQVSLENKKPFINHSKQIFELTIYMFIVKIA